MKILARASSLTGFVDAVAPTQGMIELAGLQIHMEHGAVVNVGDFVDLEAMLGADKVWTGRIKAHFTMREKSNALAPPAHSGQSDETAPGTGAQASGSTAQSSTPGTPSGPGAAGGAPTSSNNSGQGTATATVGQASSAGQAPVSGRRRFGPGAGGQRNASGPSASGSSAASARPRFTPSSADEKVHY